MARKIVSPPPPEPYDVGYCKPPVGPRWQKGQSGNPSGRRRAAAEGAPSPAIGGLSAENEAVLKILRATVTLDGASHGRRVTQLEAIVEALARQAACGDVRAVKMVLEAYRQAGEAEERLMASNRVSPELVRLLNAFVLQQNRDSFALTPQHAVEGDDRAHVRAWDIDTRVEPAEDGLPAHEISSSIREPGPPPDAGRAAIQALSDPADPQPPGPNPIDPGQADPNLRNPAPQPSRARPVEQLAAPAQERKSSAGRDTPPPPQCWEKPAKPALPPPRAAAPRRRYGDPLIVDPNPLQGFGYLKAR